VPAAPKAQGPSSSSGGLGTHRKRPATAAHSVAGKTAAQRREER
jgi:hypothetical protein